MKSTAAVADFPKIKFDILTDDRLHLLPSDVQKALQLIGEHKYFPKKYWTGQKSMVIRKTHKLYEQNPTLPIKQVVLTILADLPDFLPSWNVHRVVGYVTQTWKELSKAEEAPEPVGDW